MSWTKNSSLNLSQAPDKSPLIFRLSGIFEAGYTFGPLDAVVGFLVYFERIAGRGPVIAELAERPIQGGVLPACSMSYDTSKEYGDIEDGIMDDLDWNVYHSRKANALRIAGFHHPTRQIILNSWTKFSSFIQWSFDHPIYQFAVNDLVAISRVRDISVDEPFFLGYHPDAAVGSDHFWWRVSSCNKETIFKSSPTALTMLEAAGVTNKLLYQTNATGRSRAFFSKTPPNMPPRSVQPQLIHRGISSRVCFLSSCNRMYPVVF